MVSDTFFRKDFTAFRYNRARRSKVLALETPKPPGSDFETEYTFKPAINNTLPRKAPERMSD